MTGIFPGFLANLLLLAGLLVLSPVMRTMGRRTRLGLAILYAGLNLRYLWWRLDFTVGPLTMDLEALWAWTFFGLDAGASAVLCWHFLVMTRPSNRSGEADVAEARLRAAADVEAVDILIPTYDEPEDILHRTITAAQAVDYPNFTVWVLDDGNRTWLREYCESAGVRYLVREERKGYKAGNLNHALGVTSAPLVCVVDADFALQPNFLWRTAGLLNDPGIGLVQTPQIFRNPDAIQYNLHGERAWPEAQCMFTDVMQSGRDSWDNAFCYGTSFVVRRRCLEEVGGIPENTISEDLHTSYLLLGVEYKTRFLNEPLSEGFATQNIGGFVVQRARWCAGTLQCLFAENGVLRSKRLSIMDRLFFLDPILYHLGTLWILCMLLAPAAYWWLGVAPFQASFGHLLVAFTPRMLVGIFALYWLSGRRTIPVVAELERVVGIFHLLKAMGSVALNPFSQTFKTTNKELSSHTTTIHWHVLWPHLTIIGVTLAGMAYRFWGPDGPVFFLQPNIGLMLSLTIYVLWLLFLACLACVQRPIPGGLLHTIDAVRTGSVRRTLHVLLRRIFAW